MSQLLLFFHRFKLTELESIVTVVVVVVFVVGVVVVVFVVVIAVVIAVVTVVVIAVVVVVVVRIAESALRDDEDMALFCQELLKEGQESDDEDMRPPKQLEGMDAPLIFLRQHGQRHKELQR